MCAFVLVLKRHFFGLLLTIEQGTVMGSVTGRVYGPGNCPLDSKHVVIGQTPLRI